MTQLDLIDVIVFKRVVRLVSSNSPLILIAVVLSVVSVASVERQLIIHKVIIRVGQILLSRVKRLQRRRRQMRGIKQLSHIKNQIILRIVNARAHQNRLDRLIGESATATATLGTSNVFDDTLSSG